MLLTSLPMGKVLAAVYFLLMLVFLASHLDAVSFTVAATSTRNLREGDDPSPGLRVFWCIMLAALPMAMLYIDAPLSTLKTAVVLAAIPFIFVLVVMVVGLFRWLREDYGTMCAYQIEEKVAAMALEEWGVFPIPVAVANAVESKLKARA